RYATAFAVLGREIPCVTTAMGDEFGGSIPCGGVALIGGGEIGAGGVETLSNSHSPPLLLQNHRVVALRRDPGAAGKATVMTEDNAAIVWLALQIGTPLTISEEDIARLHDRYTHVYGQ